MKVLRDPEACRQVAPQCVATIGKFDGVHRGHQAIIRQLQETGARLGLPTVVIVIEPHPEEFFAASPEQCPPRLTTLAEKLRLLEALGVDITFVLGFDAALAQRSAADYVSSLLVAGLGVRALIIGRDFRFGHRRSGDFTLLTEMGAAAGFSVAETEDCRVAGERVSSTAVRQALEQGDFAWVTRLLGRPYSILGDVIPGRRLGADLGFPTCNIALHRHRIPLHGVYACEVLWGAQVLPAAVNIGYRPTVTDAGEAVLEAHLLDFNGDLYGQSLTVRFCQRIRAEQKFPDLDALKAQIAQDVAAVRAWFATAPATDPSDERVYNPRFSVEPGTLHD